MAAKVCKKQLTMCRAYTKLLQAEHLHDMSHRRHIASKTFSTQIIAQHCCSFVLFTWGEPVHRDVMAAGKHDVRHASVACIALQDLCKGLQECLSIENVHRRTSYVAFFNWIM